MKKAILLISILTIVPFAGYSTEKSRYEIKVVKLPLGAQADNVVVDGTVVFDNETGKLWVVMPDESTGTTQWNIVPIEYTPYATGLDYVPPKIPPQRKRKVR